MRVLDLFCGAGGAAAGYIRAGLDVVGIDLRNQPHYPGTFWKADALQVLRTIVAEGSDDFDLIHASPPCQGYSLAVSSDGRWSHGVHTGFNEPRLIEPVRELMIATGIPYVIENVRRAVPHMIDPVRLCGPSFGLAIQRHRYFESSFPIREPEHVKCVNLTHPTAEAWIAQDPDRRDRRIYSVVGKSRQAGSIEVWQELMEMPWAKPDYELAEAIPPAYTEWVGREFVRDQIGRMHRHDGERLYCFDRHGMAA